MRWNTFLAEIDRIRGLVRSSRDIKIGFISNNEPILDDLRNLIDTAATDSNQIRKLEIELDPDGRPIIPDELKPFFVKEAAGETKIEVEADLPSKGEVRVVMLPRDTPLVKRTPSLKEVKEEDLGKDE